MNPLLQKFAEQHISNVPEEIKIKPISTKNYIICITPRSGSTWLMDLIHKTQVLGHPNEWFNTDDMHKRILKYSSSSIWEYIDAIRRDCASTTGVFGVQFSYIQLERLLEIVSIEQLFGRMPIWFYLTRKNLIQQGISNFLSADSGYFHSYQEQHKYDAYLQLEYDAAKIEYWCEHILLQETKFEETFVHYQVEPIRITYEDVVANKDRILRLFHNVLNVPIINGNVQEAVIRKISNHRNLDWEQRFRSERPEFIEKCEQTRQEFRNSF